MKDRTANPETSRQTLDNGTVRVTVDARARLHELTHLECGHNYAAGKPLWRLFIERGQQFQVELRAEDSLAQLSADATSLTIEYSALHCGEASLPIRLKLHAELKQDELHWQVDLENASEGEFLIKEFQFPLVGDCQLSDEALITTEMGGQRFADPIDYVRQRYKNTNQPYSNEDYISRPVLNVYPGLQAAANCFHFSGADRGLYFGSHDPSFRNTVHQWALTPEEQLEAGMIKHVFLRSGERLQIPGYVLSPYSGSWHTAAAKYQRWTGSWYRPLPKPEWIKDFRGWQRLILKHQNGEILFPYDSFPQISEIGKSAGISGLFMFAWWPGGMDRMYPDYVPDPEMGGEAALRENIQKFQELGGEVIFYASGRLVDRASDFFKQHGRRLAIKTRSGGEARDAYLFSNRSSYERLYGAVELSPMCPDCPEWVEVLKGVVDMAADYGCKGVFFDQLGTQEYPCCDPNHGHPVPYVTQTEGKREAIRQVRDHCRKVAPEMAFGVEIFADCVGEYFDFVHGLYLQTNMAANPDYQERGVKAKTSCFIDWTKFVFPEVIISDRDIRDGEDVPRRVNFAVLRGLVHDVEVYRCRRTIDAIPEYQDYLGQVTALRQRHADVLIRGTYRDTLGFTVDSDELDARAFVCGDRMGILVTQSHLNEVVAQVTAPGWVFTGLDQAGDGAAEGTAEGDRTSTDEQVQLRLPRHALMLLQWRRIENAEGESE
jgi:hypothetical protein